MKLKLKQFSSMTRSSSNGSHSSSGRASPVQSLNKGHESPTKTASTTSSPSPSTGASSKKGAMRFPFPSTLKSPESALDQPIENHQMPPDCEIQVIAESNKSLHRPSFSIPSENAEMDQKEPWSISASSKSKIKSAITNNNGGARSDPKSLKSRDAAAMKEYKQIFDQFDANKDGKISVEEVKAVLRTLGEGEEGLKEAERMVEEADKDGDGYVDLEEFVDLNRRFEGEATSNEELREVFLVFDLDRDGQITAEELHAVLGKLGDGETTVEDCRRMVGRVDRKGHGHVDFDDFKLMMTTAASTFF